MPLPYRFYFLQVHNRFNAKTPPIDWNLKSRPIDFRAKLRPIDFIAKSCPIDLNANTPPIDCNVQSHLIDFNVKSHPIDFNAKTPATKKCCFILNRASMSDLFFGDCFCLLSFLKMLFYWLSYWPIGFFARSIQSCPQARGSTSQSKRLEKMQSHLAPLSAALLFSLVSLIPQMGFLQPPGVLHTSQISSCPFSRLVTSAFSVSLDSCSCPDPPSPMGKKSTPT